MKGVSGRAIAVGVGSHAGKVGKGKRNPDGPPMWSLTGLSRLRQLPLVQNGIEALSLGYKDRNRLVKFA
jgi:hypothetical protein